MSAWNPASKEENSAGHDQLKQSRLVLLDRDDSALCFFSSAIKAFIGRVPVIFKVILQADDASVLSWGEDVDIAFIVLRGSLKTWDGTKRRHMSTGDFTFVQSAGSLSYWSDEGDQAELLCFTTLEDETDLNLLEPQLVKERDFSGLDSLPMEPQTETKLSASAPTYFLPADTSLPWIFSGVVSKPFIRAHQCNGAFSISTIQSSSAYNESPPTNRWISFTSAKHTCYVVEGEFLVKFKDGNSSDEWTTIRPGETASFPPRRPFTVRFGGDLVRVIILANGLGIDELIYRAGIQPKDGILPLRIGRWDGWDEARLISACVEVGALIVSGDHC